jgi:hypothetical protein
MQHGWPWFAARIMAGTLMDETTEWVVAGEGPARLTARLRTTWAAMAGTEPGCAAWQRLAGLVVEPASGTVNVDCVGWTTPCLTAA